MLCIRYTIIFPNHSTFCPFVFAFVFKTLVDTKLWPKKNSREPARPKVERNPTCEVLIIEGLYA